MRRAAKVDANQGEIVSALRRAGCLVAITSSLGKGFPDLVAVYGLTGRVRFLEVKDGSLPPSARKLTEREAEFRDAWGDYHVAVVTSPEEALEAMGVAFS